VKSILKGLLVLIGVLVVSAFLAPILAKFIPYEFDRILSRVVMVLFLVVGAIWVAKSRGIDFKGYGLVWRKDAPRLFVTAFLLGFLTLTLMTGIEMIIGIRSWKFTFFEVVWPLKILKYTVSCLFIGLLEEFLFRGMLFTALEKRIKLWPALIGANAIYSIVHFLRYEGGEITSVPTFLTSLEVYGATLKPFTDLGHIIPGGVGLFLFGMALSFGYLKFGRNLIFPIALHAGSVFFLYLDRWFIHIENETYKIWFGGSDLHACILGWAAISFMALIIWKLPKQKI